MREKILTVTIHDCDVQTFHAGGKGGQNQNKRDTGVRVVHRPSGAVGESREERSQLQNKRLAWNRMLATDKFQLWLRLRCGDAARIEAEVERDMAPHRLRVETYDGTTNTWREIVA